MYLLRLIALASLTLLPAVACDAVSRSERGQDVGAAPPAPVSLSPSSLSPSVVATPATLFEHVIDRARRLAQAEYSPPDAVLPRALASLDYEQYQSIRFRPEAAVWHDEALFEVQLFHPGYLYDKPVALHLVQDGRIASLPFDPRLFRYDGAAARLADLDAPALGYAGFRIHYPLNDATIKDEVVVFLGASYFRLLGSGHVYGLSSRGVAVDVALDRDEEFPAFREFWLVRPESGAATATFYGLLDSPSVAGAYHFELTPGPSTELAVEARLFARRDIDKLGVAPMSSMFLYDQNHRPRPDDFRAQVHDSDGVLVQTADDDWIWRPLSNPPVTQVASVYSGTPRGFGLLQRDRDFDNYLDLEANYHRRPSEWVTLEDGDWGSGTVELLTFHSASEFIDNVALYWVPSQRFRAGDQRRYRYRLTMFDDRLPGQTDAQVTRARVGWDALPGQSAAPPRSQRRFVVDFEGGTVAVGETADAVEAILEASTGQTANLTVQPLPEARGWRAAFRLIPSGARSADLRLHLEVEGRRVSEIWSYTWYPEGVE